MKLWNFQLVSKTRFNYDQTYLLTMRDTNNTVLSECKSGDKVTFWSMPHLTEVSIYPANLPGGGPPLGYVPSQHRDTIRNHILARRPYRATIFDKTGTIAFSLTSKEQEIKNELEDIEKRRNQIVAKLARKYNGLKSPILVRFHVTGEGNFEELHLTFKDEAYYLDHPMEAKLELADNNGKIVAEAPAPFTTVLNVLKAHFDGRKLKVSNISVANEILHATISAEK